MGEMIKAPGLRPRAFISFLVFGNPDEILALVFEILPVVSKEAVVRGRLRARCFRAELRFMFVERKFSICACSEVKTRTRSPISTPELFSFAHKIRGFGDENDS